MHRIMISAVTLAAAAACATPNPPTVSASDVNRAYAEARYISGLPFTPTSELPTGSTTYRGKLGADVGGDLDGSILGDMTMNVDFARNNVGGSVSNINLIDGSGRPDQRLGGSLAIDGFESSGRIDAFASGNLTAVDYSGFRRGSDVVLRMDGDVYNDRGRGDAVFGSAQGSGTGNLDLTFDGVFFGTAN